MNEANILKHLKIDLYIELNKQAHIYLILESKKIALVFACLLL